MLHRIRGVRQDEAARERIWFQDEFFDLFVWTDASGTIVAFQLCYDRLNGERVLAWNQLSGFSHRAVDDGENTPLKNMSPIMVTDGHFAAERIRAEFEQRSNELDVRLHDFICGKIHEAGRMISGTAA